MHTFAAVKQFLISLLIVFAMPASSHGEVADRSVDSLLQTIGIPVVEVFTVDEEEPTYEDADAPEGCLGGSIRNAVKVPGRILMYHATDTLYDSGPYDKNVSGMTIKVRGNWSARRPKKPYKIKLQQAAGLLSPASSLLSPDSCDTNWLLMPFFDLNEMIGLEVSELMDLQWTPRYRFVNLVFNGDYRGLYMLMESVNRNPSCRLDVSETGFIAELDAYWWNGTIYAKATFGEPLNYTFKYPDKDDLTANRLDYFQHILSAAEQSTLDGTYQSCVDVESFARWMLTHDILGNRDGAGSNMFLTKYDDSDTTLLRMGCLWDFDVIMESKGWDELHNRYFFGRMFHSGNRAFADSYIALWDEKKDHVTDGILHFLDDYLHSPLCQAVDVSIGLNNDRWAREMYALPLSADFVNGACEWFVARRGWLDEAIHDPAAILPARLPLSQKGLCDDVSSPSYDLLGRHILNPSSLGHSPFYIRNGKKMLNK